MTPPPLTREARDWLLSHIDWHSDNSYVVCRKLNSMPLAPADPLDAVRARWQKRTIGGYEVQIVGASESHIFGYSDSSCAFWTVQGTCLYMADCYRGTVKDLTRADLLPQSAHAALIAELLQRADIAERAGQHNDTKLFRCAADALEKLP